MRKSLSNSLALAALLSIGITTTAQADVIRIFSNPVVMPRTQTIVVPTSRQLLMPSVVRTRTVITPSTTIRTLPAVIPVTPASTTTTTITPVAPVTTTTSTTTVTETKVKMPDFPSRLHNMMDQITLGESNGMLSTDESAILRAEYSRLDSLIQADLVDGLTTIETDDLEKQLTLFNQQISNMMQ